VSSTFDFVERVPALDAVNDYAGRAGLPLKRHDQRRAGGGRGITGPAPRTGRGVASGAAGSA
jgi:hypothetical protein